MTQQIMSDSGAYSAKSQSSNSLIRGCESFEHQVDHADVDHGLAGFGVAFVIFAVTAAAAKPREGAFDDPTFRHQHEAAASPPILNSDVYLRRFLLIVEPPHQELTLFSERPLFLGKSTLCFRGVFRLSTFWYVGCDTRDGCFGDAQEKSPEPTF